MWFWGRSGRWGQWGQWATADKLGKAVLINAILV